jgi:hypothetical protein
MHSKMETVTWRRPISHRKFERNHQLDGFDCGPDELDGSLRRYARMADAAGAARSYVLADDNRVLFPNSMPKACLPIPSASSCSHALLSIAPSKARDTGALMADAAVRTFQAADLVGARAMLVHARDERAAAFYERLGFTRSPTDALHLKVLIKDFGRTFG